MNLVSRSTAIKQDLKTYYTGKPCLHGHLDSRLVSNRACITCLKIKRVLWGEKNKSSVLQKAAENSRRNRKENKDKTQASRRLWASKNRSKDNAYSAKWRANNKAHMLMLLRKRQTSKINRTPSWLDAVDLAEIEFTYMWCSALRECGLDYHVDHIIPLQGKTVSGLHVPWNLQVIPAVENIRKGNRCNYA
jgi:hypothetical protein